MKNDDVVPRLEAVDGLRPHPAPPRYSYDTCPRCGCYLSYICVALVAAPTRAAVSEQTRKHPDTCCSRWHLSSDQIGQSELISIGNCIATPFFARHKVRSGHRERNTPCAQARPPRKVHVTGQVTVRSWSCVRAHPAVSEPTRHACLQRPGPNPYRSPSGAAGT